MKKKNNTTAWAVLRISAATHEAVRRSQAIESGRRKQPISQTNWLEEVIAEGLKAKGY